MKKKSVFIKHDQYSYFKEIEVECTQDHFEKDIAKYGYIEGHAL